jgi:hypothetical protein
MFVTCNKHDTFRTGFRDTVVISPQQLSHLTMCAQEQTDESAIHSYHYRNGIFEDPQLETGVRSDFIHARQHVIIPGFLNLTIVLQNQDSWITRDVIQVS